MLDLSKYEVLTDEELSKISGGFGWESAFEGLFGGIGVNPYQTAQQVINQLNGVSGFQATPHNPYGTGGTPND